VRFVYLRRPNWYLSVQRRRDVLEYPLDNDLDVSGWDLKKALGLFASRLSHALAAIPRGSAPDWEALDGVFRESLVEVWDGRASA